ncbi:MAG: argininosuccinate lyase [Clostridia bacterium]|nr:argininosuccinate lyase [Clostridia bacterium]
MKLWQGRTDGRVDELVNTLTTSLPFDVRLFREDIEGSIAHARMLGFTEIIRPEESSEIIAGLECILAQMENGSFEFEQDDEDIHTAVERALIAAIGEAGKKLHTGRSRNDQVALDMRLWCLRRIAAIQDSIKKLQTVLVDLSGQHVTTIMPGYTHLQHAQPVTLGHHLMAYFWMLQRDWTRLADCRFRTDVMPLGVGALAGTAYPLDREFVKRELGFFRISENSLDTVADRDFVIELVSACTLIMTHLSRLCEELVLWSTWEFRFVELEDEYTTGSSMMPQKKNPDAAELIRGKTGRVTGDLMSLLMTMKALPLAYNRDMQEDKERLFDASDTVLASLGVMSSMLATAHFRGERMARAASAGYTLATDVADFLVGKGMPFRDAHHLVGQIVRDCAAQGIELEELTVEEWSGYSPLLDSAITGVLNADHAVARRCVPGGPAPEEVMDQIACARAILSARPCFLVSKGISSMIASRVTWPRP